MCFFKSHMHITVVGDKWCLHYYWLSMHTYFFEKHGTLMIHQDCTVWNCTDFFFPCNTTCTYKIQSYSMYTKQPLFHNSHKCLFIHNSWTSGVISQGHLDALDSWDAPVYCMQCSAALCLSNLLHICVNSDTAYWAHLPLHIAVHLLYLTIALCIHHTGSSMRSCAAGWRFSTKYFGI